MRIDGRSGGKNLTWVGVLTWEGSATKTCELGRDIPANQTILVTPSMQSGRVTRVVNRG